MSAVEVIREELTYRRDAERSYFKDRIDAERGDHAASERLRRHELEVRDEVERRNQAALSQKPEDVEYRVNPNRTPGAGGNFSPPLWLIDRFASVPRAPRVLADLLPTFPLPSGVQSVNIPRLITGTAATSENDGQAAADQDITDAQVSSAVVTISGQGDVPLQLLDQSPPGAHLDWAIFKDLNEAYDEQLEIQLINGQGTAAGQLLGLLQIVPASNKITTTQATATGMFGAIGQVVAAVGINRKMPPENWLMTTARFAWLGSSEDAQSRPLMITDKDGTGEFDLLAIEVKLDDAVPRTLGPAANPQDTIIACRPSDGLLLESAPRTMIDFNSLSGTLQARIQLHRYVAALNGRYPTSVATLTGTGLVLPTGF